MSFFPPSRRGRTGPRASTPDRRPTEQRHRLRLEPLEDRTTPTTFTVTNTSDAGPGSLRQAISDALAPGHDDIVFDPTVFSTPQTISLLTALPTLSTGNLTITGPGANLLTVERAATAPQFRVFTSVVPVLTLTGLTIRGGVSTDGGGGGALLVGGSGGLQAVLDGVVLTGNRATAPGGGSGGAGAVDVRGFLTLRNSTVTGNSGGPGGIKVTGIGPSAGGLLVENSTFSGNTNLGGGGGAVYFTGDPATSPPAGFVPGTVVIRNSTITGNSAARGAGVRTFNMTGTLLIDGCTVSGNTATEHGGGISATRGTVFVRNSLVSGNTAAAFGGGIGVIGQQGPVEVFVQNTTVTGNTAGALPNPDPLASGGGIGLGQTPFATAASSVRVQNSTIVGNTARGTAAGAGGGGIARTAGVPGAVAIANSIVSGNTNVNGPDVLTGATTTVDVNFSAIGSPAGFTPSAASGNNLPFGTDLKLTPLTLVGGPTPAFAPKFGSPLVDAGSTALVPAGLTTDQRGGAFARVVGAAVDIGSIESQPPYLPIAVATAAPVTTAGEPTYEFTVTYSDPLGPRGMIDLDTVVGNDAAVRVTGPNGFDVPATYVSIDLRTNEWPTATYRITPPGGTWDPADIGAYTVRMQANQVADADGNFVAAGAIGTFDVRSPYVVTTTADAGPGSLRAAVTAANATATADTITFDPAVFGTPQTIDLLTALPMFVAGGGAVTVAGPGQANLTVRRAAGAPDFRIFDSVAPALTLSDLTVRGGRAGTGAGGGLQSRGQVVLDRVTLTDNQAAGGGGVRFFGTTLTVRNTTITGNASTARGGGLTATGTLVIEYSELSGNTAATGGGGLDFSGPASPAPPPGFVSGVIVVRNSTLAGNTAETDGGGIALTGFSGTLQVLNSTLSGNTAGTVGGGLSLASGSGSVLLQDSTVVLNTANGAGGGGLARLSTTAGTITVANSVVSQNGNAAAPDIVTGATGTTANVNYSAVGSPAGFTPSPTSGNNLAFGVDPLLGPLANNGGPTRTHLPRAGSPLIDAGSNDLIPFGVTTDQRGVSFPRVVNGVVDIGSVETPRGRRLSASVGPDVTGGPARRSAGRAGDQRTRLVDREAAAARREAATVAGTFASRHLAAGYHATLGTLPRTAATGRVRADGLRSRPASAPTFAAVKPAGIAVTVPSVAAPTEPHEPGPFAVRIV
jgi:predicted outer membrane repeat protein